MSNKHDDAAADLLIKEVDEDLRQDQVHRLWKTYGNAIVGAAVALVLSVAAWQGWTAWQAKQSLAASERYTAALALAAEGKTEEASQMLAKVASEGTAGYRPLARLQQADLALAGGDAQRAVALYDTVAADGGVDAVYRDLARLKAAYLKLDLGEVAEVESGVQALASEASPWRHSAREILALAAFKRGDTAKAVELFGKLADDAVAPQGVRARAAEMLAAVGGKAAG